MTLTLFQVDAFTDHLFGGNPAAVCPLEQWLPDATMQNIAMENNLAETAFFIPKEDHFHLRWFTPAVEVDLCGHATLATAYVLFHYLDWKKPELVFESRSGILRVKKDNDLLTLDFPADSLQLIEPSKELNSCLGIEPLETYLGKTDFMAVVASQKEVENLQPDFLRMSRLTGRGVIVTAPGETVDFVSRFFAPQVGINEDPVTGSAHTTLTPFWSARLGKTNLKAIQLSARKGHLNCQLKGDRVEISGKGQLYMKGDIHI